MAVACGAATQITIADARREADTGETRSSVTAATASRNEPTWRVRFFRISKYLRPPETGGKHTLTEMTFLRDRIRPALYDYLGGRMEEHFAAYRRNALAHVGGHVLE